MSVDIYAPALAAHTARIREVLCGLIQASRVPQVLLFEGGTEAERQSLALWWAAAHHCMPTGGDVTRPCLRCAPCMQVATRVHLDTLAFDGRISNKDDDENPGPVRALTADNARTLKTTLATLPHSSQRRAVILCGLEGTRREAANALLKVLEEPSQTVTFVLLAPLRAQILPTLVSRSFVLTLPWPNADRDTDTDVGAGAITTGSARPIIQGLADMMTTQRGWWHLTSGKGAVDVPLAESVLLACQKALTLGLRSAASAVDTTHPLRQRFEAFSPAQALATGRLLSEAQEALRSNVHPARVLDCLAVSLCGLTGPPPSRG